MTNSFAPTTKFDLATSFALAQALRKVGEVFGEPDVIFTGKQTIDGDTAQVGPGIAKRLKLNQLTYVAKIQNLDQSEGSITVERRAEGGLQVLKTKLPVLITMLEGSNEMRRGTLEDALRAAKAEVTIWNAEAAGIEDVTKCGLRGSPTIVKKVFAPTAREDKAEQIDVAGKSSEGIADAFIAALFERQPDLEGELMTFASTQYGQEG